MKHPRWIFILTKNGEILPEELKNKILTQIRMDDHPDEYDYHIMEGDDWVFPCRIGYNIKPNSIVVWHIQIKTKVYTNAIIEEIRHAMMTAYDTKTSWEVIHDLG